MITDSEKRWLRDRKLAPHPYCGWCMKYALCCSPRFAMCPTDYTPADDFEARVAAKLAKYAAKLSWNIDCSDCPAHKACTLSENRNIDCGDIFLKAAHLAVEEMDDADGK